MKLISKADVVLAGGADVRLDDGRLTAGLRHHEVARVRHGRIEGRLRQEEEMDGLPGRESPRDPHKRAVVDERGVGRGERVSVARNPTEVWLGKLRLLVQGGHVEHWLNGKKVLEYELGSDKVKAGLAESKFRKLADFGTKIRGHIMLTYHNDECWFRNIKIREL